MGLLVKNLRVADLQQLPLPQLLLLVGDATVELPAWLGILLPIAVLEGRRALLVLLANLVCMGIVKRVCPQLPLPQQLLVLVVITEPPVWLGIAMIFAEQGGNSVTIVSKMDVFA
jgi:hypothetical protein